MTSLLAVRPKDHQEAVLIWASSATAAAPGPDREQHDGHDEPEDPLDILEAQGYHRGTSSSATMAPSASTAIRSAVLVTAITSARPATSRPRRQPADRPPAPSRCRRPRSTPTNERTTGDSPDACNAVGAPSVPFSGRGTVRAARSLVSTSSRLRSAAHQRSARSMLQAGGLLPRSHPAHFWQLSRAQHAWLTPTADSSFRPRAAQH